MSMFQAKIRVQLHLKLVSKLLHLNDGSYFGASISKCLIVSSFLYYSLSPKGHITHIFSDLSSA